MTTLNKPVLVLNRNWTVIGTTTVKEAIVLMMRGNAKGLCTTSFVVYEWDKWIEEGENLPDVEHHIKTSSASVPAPQVVILTNYNNLHKTSIKFSNRGVYRRDRFICQYCNGRKRTDDLSIDHVIPRSKSGATSWENCVTACVICNNRKSDKTPRQAGMTLTNKPKRPAWSPVIHIQKEKRPEAWKPLLKAHW